MGTIAERLRALAEAMRVKLMEPVQHGPCQHAPDCPGHYGEVHWRGMKAAKDELLAIASEVERIGAEARACSRLGMKHTICLAIGRGKGRKARRGAK